VLGIIAPLIDWLELISIAYASDLIDKEPKTPIETVSSLVKDAASLARKTYSRQSF